VKVRLLTIANVSDESEKRQSVSLAHDLPHRHLRVFRPITTTHPPTTQSIHIMSSDRDRVAELEAQLAQAQSTFAEKMTKIKNTKKRLATSIKHNREKDAEIREIEGHPCPVKASYEETIDELTTQILTRLRIQSHITTAGLFELAELIKKQCKNYSDPGRAQQSSRCHHQNGHS
jgi:hypothetical protein